MRTQLLLLAATFAVPLGAPAQTSAPDTLHRVTLVGCVRRSQPDIVATTGTTAIDADETRYVLANITLSPDPTQTATAEVLAERIQNYQLDDAADGVIAAHVGEKVEVTGTVNPAAPQKAPPKAGL